MAKLAINGGPKLRERPFPPWPQYDDGEKQALLEVLQSRRWGTRGPKVLEFEEEFCRYTGVSHGITTCNGTVSLQIILRSLGVGRGDEVIVPPYTFVATVTAVLMVQAIPVFVDIDPGSNCIDPGKIEQAITERTKAIIAVHIAGCPSDMDRIIEISERHNLFIVEDAAQAHGSEWRGKKVGGWGSAGSFSFQLSKNISSGEGGLITTDDLELAERCWSLHNVGRSKEGKWYEHFVLAGNYRMTDWQAAILLVQLKRLDQQIDIREKNARYLNENLQEMPGIGTFPRDPRVTRDTHHLYMFRYLEEELKKLPKENFVKALEKEGIPVSEGYYPLYRLPLFQTGEVLAITGRDRDYSQLRLPATEQAFRQTVWITQNVLLGDRGDMDDILGAIKKIRDNVDELL
jgi:dTDP-4-amino-4,6-dideoxygalactose transaminase